MKGILKKLLSVFIVVALIGSSPISYGSAVDNILYETREKETISSGVTYEKNIRFTEAGWVDVHILEIDLTNPYVKLDVIRNTDGFGIKDTLTSIATENNVIAGINGDFFSMSNDPTDILGFEYEKDGIIIGKHLLNAGENAYGSLFLDSDNEPFIDFMKITLNMTSDDGEELYVYGMNRVTTFDYPIYFDKAAMSDTAELDEKNPGLCKMIVEDNTVTYLSAVGETVSMPEDGYMIIMNEKTASFSFNNFPVGTKVNYEMNTNIDLDSIDLAISGGGKIISNGRLATGGLVVQGNKRHPRSAIGYNENKDKLYMVVVDGRGSSIGVNHEELANILLDIGLYEAIHLDGGGSSTLVARELGDANVKVFNRPSGGGQRRIPNGIGIISTAPVSDLYEIKIMADTTRVFKDMPITFSVIGYDKYYNPIPIDNSELYWQTIGIGGKWDDNKFYPINEGKATIKAYLNGKSAEINIECMAEPISLEINNKYSILEPGESTKLKILGINKDGYRGEINAKNVQWDVKNDAIGAFYDGQFVASNDQGYSLITGKIGETTVYGYIIVHEEKNLVDSFKTDTKIKSVVYPDTVQGNVEVINSMPEGNNSIKLGYSFMESTVTQAAYIEFETPYTFEEKLDKLGLNVQGNGLNHWLRGRILDAKGDYHNITFTYAVDWTGWKYVAGSIPKDIPYPIQLDRIYIATLHSQEAGNWELTFDDLTAHYAYDTSTLVLPQEEIYDPLYKLLIGEPEMNISVFGSTASKNRLLDHIIQRSVVETMDEISDVSLFVGDTDVTNEVVTNDTVIWNDSYQVTDYDNVRIINLATSKNSIRLTDPNQWKTFVNDLYQTSQKHVMITMDNNPLDRNGFTDKREGQLFHDVLKKFKDEKDKNIFVINGSGYDFNVDYIEGIRYMDVNGLWYKVYDKNKVDLNDKFYIINFYITADNISYKVLNVYPKIIIE